MLLNAWRKSSVLSLRLNPLIELQCNVSESNEFQKMAITHALYEKGPVNFGPLITETYVSTDPLKRNFWGYYISALRGCCALKFLHALQIDQALLAHTGTGRGVPPNLIVKI